MSQPISAAFIVMLLCATQVWAGQAENIKKCVEVANSFGASIDPYQVRYNSHFLQLDVAEWRDVRCEVKLENIHNLTIRGKEVIYKGFAGREAYELNERLEKELDGASEILVMRANLLKSMKSEIEKKLMNPGVDVAVIERDVLSNVKRALSTPPDRPLSMGASTQERGESQLREDRRPVDSPKQIGREPNSSDDKSYPITIPSDRKADYFVFEKGEWQGMPTLLTKRVGSSGTTYSLRVFDCQSHTAKYLGTGESLAAMRNSRPDPSMYEVLSGSIAYYLWLHACNK